MLLANENSDGWQMKGLQVHICKHVQLAISTDASKIGLGTYNMHFQLHFLWYAVKRVLKLSLSKIVPGLILLNEEMPYVFKDVYSLPSAPRLVSYPGSLLTWMAWVQGYIQLDIYNLCWGWWKPILNNILTKFFDGTSGVWLVILHYIG